VGQAGFTLVGLDPIRDNGPAKACGPLSSKALGVLSPPAIICRRCMEVKLKKILLLALFITAGCRAGAELQANAQALSTQAAAAASVIPAMTAMAGMFPTPSACDTAAQATMDAASAIMEGPLAATEAAAPDAYGYSETYDAAVDIYNGAIAWGEAGCPTPTTTPTP